MHYCQKCGEYVEQCRHDDRSVLSVSGTEGRKLLSLGQLPPLWFMREEISNLVIKELAQGQEVFTK